MSHALLATKIGQKLASKLQGITDEKVIKALTIDAWNELREAITNPSTFSSRGLSNARKAIKEAFPDSETPKAGYYFTNQGKGQTPRYEHLALWYLTSNTDRWNVSGDKARQIYVEGLPTLPTPESEPQSKLQPELQTHEENIMTILTKENQALLARAMELTGLERNDFINRAVATYANTRLSRDTCENGNSGSKQLLYIGFRDLNWF
jgi:hypothetical protein